jgi:hypothetical protein
MSENTDTNTFTQRDLLQHLLQARLSHKKSLKTVV